MLGAACQLDPLEGGNARLAQLLEPYQLPREVRTTVNKWNGCECCVRQGREEDSKGCLAGSLTHVLPAGWPLCRFLWATPLHPF